MDYKCHTYPLQGSDMKIHDKSALESPKVTRTSPAENKCTELTTPFACFVIQSKDQPGAFRIQGENYGKKTRKVWKIEKLHQTSNIEKRSLTFSEKLLFDFLPEKYTFRHLDLFWTDLLRKKYTFWLLQFVREKSICSL